MKKLVLSCLALASAALITATASAQSIVTYTNGDLFFGMRSSDGTNSYLVDIGSPSQILSLAPGATFTFTLGNINADITSTFGLDWYTRIDPNTGTNAVLWSIVGTAQQAVPGVDVLRTLYSSNIDSANPFARGSSAGQGNTAGFINTMGQTWNGSTSTANSPFGVIQANTLVNGYNSQQSGGISFQRWSGAEGTPGAQLALNRLIPATGASIGTPSQYTGYFNLSSSGVLTYTAVPEPSTYAMFGVAVFAGLFVVARRRRAVTA
jgi:hypothetical protein